MLSHGFIFILCISQSVFIISIVLHAFFNASHEKTQHLSSSIVCFGTNKSTRQCLFKNLYYDPTLNEYLFSHGPLSSMLGVPDSRNNPAFLDISSVDDHNAKYFFYTDVSSSFIQTKKITATVSGPSILFHRFNPENLMHIFHDDLIPLFYTKKTFFSKNDVNFIIMDGRDPGPYMDLYKLYSNSIYFKSNFTKGLIHFEEVLIGLSKRLTWYQYGFKVPQGPINIINYPRHQLKHFINEFISKTAPVVPSKSQYIVLLSRTATRKILNEGQLVFKLTTLLRLPVHTVSIEDVELHEVIGLISNANLVIGMHGAQLILSLFMNPGSILVELFPYAIPAQNYIPYKTLAQLIDLKYIVWVNNNINNTFPHPDWVPAKGGIAHLPPELQLNLTSTHTVPSHLCCTNPFWLYRIYQDTIVDVNDLQLHLERIELNQVKSKESVDDCLVNNNIYCRIHPAKISGIACSRMDGNITLNWEMPWNIAHFKLNKISYEVVLSTQTKDYLSFMVNTTHFVYRAPVGLNYFVFIRSIFNKNFGEFSKKIYC